MYICEATETECLLINLKSRTVVIGLIELLL